MQLSHVVSCSVCPGTECLTCFCKSTEKREMEKDDALHISQYSQETSVWNSWPRSMR